MITLSVSQLNHYLKSLCDGDDNLRGLFVCGEISNFTRHRSGHLYFSLKDGDASIRCVMFARQAATLRFPIDDGIRVLCGGRVSVYEGSGSCQLYVERIAPDGEGAAKLALERLYKKLQEEGLFSAERKLPLPQFPQRVAVITSASGAALIDVKTVWQRKWPAAELILYPAAVQGANAVEEICTQLKKMTADTVDAVLLVRGGGSSEDLWVFNDERLVRAVADCPVPLISAVGHEVDYTLCDLAASARSATPTAAADLIFPDQTEVSARVQSTFATIRWQMLQKLQHCRQQTETVCTLLKTNSPQNRLELQQQRLSALSDSLLRSSLVNLQNRQHRFAKAAAALESLSPMATLLRGYAYVSNGETIVTTAKQARSTDTMTLHFADGTICVHTERNDPDAR